MDRSNLSPGVRATLQRFPPPYDHAYGVVPLPPPSTLIPLTAIAQRVRDADAALARVEAYATTLHDSYVVSRILIRQEAVSSSAIEGTQSTLDELLTSEETQDEEARAAVKSVRRYAQALMYYVARAERHGAAVFQLGLLKQLHRQVMREDERYRDKPGELRHGTVWIGSKDIAYSTFNPPPAPQVPGCLEQNLVYMRDDQNLQQSLVTRMAVAHAHFEAVHPFRDGNGRVGRLLLPIMMAADGRTPLYLSAYIEAHKQAYYDALKAAQQREDWVGMIGFMADAIVGATAELMRTREGLSELANIWSTRRTFRKGSSSLRALDVLSQYPVLTITRLAVLLKVTFPAAGKAVDQLCEAGILRERTGYARNRIFLAPEALSIMNRPFGEAPVVPER
ncbi:MAG: Fic family protein [Caulobacter sp.]|nr:Fic family protein [Caulobacter sp.]